MSVKRKIAAVLMAEAASTERAQAGGGRARLAEHQAVIRDIIVHDGGRLLPSPDETVLAEFLSAVEGVRAGVAVQETLRARNAELSLVERQEFRLGITIGDLPDGQGEIPVETLSEVSHATALGEPGQVCISKSVREAVGRKLKLKALGVLVEGAPADPDVTTDHVLIPRPQSPLDVARALARKRPVALGGAAAVASAAVAIALTVALIGHGPQGGPGSEAAIAVIAPDPASAALPGKAKRPGDGTIEFMPAHAPDPSAVLTAKRMLPNAWKDCQGESADAAAAGCQTLLDSGIAKDDELAEIQVWHGRALRDRNELDKAIEALTASIAAKPSPGAFSLRGTVHYDKGSFEQAIADYSEAIRLDGVNGEAFNNRAWTYYRTGRIEKALADADMAVRLLAKEAYVWDTRAHIHAELGNRAAAIRDFRAALKIDPANAASKSGLARLGVN
jgi:Tfp pilus assembly protein PilF